MIGRTQFGDMKMAPSQNGKEDKMNKNLVKEFKDKLKQNKSVIGPFMKSCDPAFVEVAGYSGFDFAILDMEHGPASIETMENLVRAAIISGMVPIIRVPDTSETSIGKALDIGALGVQLPQIQNAKQAEEAIKRAKFYPQGERGMCRFVRAANYSSLDRYEYFERANESLVILQLEGQEGIDNLEEILEIDGIDILFIGPYDLSQSLGVPGDITNPKVIDQMKFIVDKAKAKGTTLGTFLDQPDQVKLWQDAGVQYLSYSVDVGIFLEGCKRIVDYI